MIPIPKFSSCSDKGYDFSVGRFNRFIFVGRPMIAFVNGGVPPYTWSITGSAFSLANVSTTSQFNQVVTNSNTVVGESAEEVTVSDACGREASFTVSCCSRYLCCDQQTIVFSVDSVDYIPTGDVILNVYGGCPPFSWRVTFGDATFATPWTELRQNTLIFGDIAEAVGVQYKVTDICGSVATGFVYQYEPYYSWVTWGTNDHNNLGVGYYSGVPIDFSVPMPGGSWRSMIGGSFGQKTDDSWYLWGRNVNGRLAYGATYDTHYSFISLESPVPGVKIIEMASVTNNSSMILEGGFAYVTGLNDDYQLGVGDNVDRNAWTPVQSGLWKKIVLFGQSTYFIALNGDLYMSGDSSYSVYKFEGINGGNKSGPLLTNFQGSAGGHKAVDAFIQTYASYFLDKAGELYAVGTSNITSFNALGYTSSTFRNVPLLIGGVKKAFFPVRRGFLLGNNGTLWAGGLNPGNVHLGLGVGQTAEATFVQIGTDTDWVDLVGGIGGCYARKSDGTWWTWGSDTGSVVGLSADLLEPTYAPVLDGIDIILGGHWGGYEI